MRETKLQQAKEAAVRAEVHKQALEPYFNHLRDAYRDAWEQCADAEARERLWHALSGLNAMRGHIEAIIANGRLAQSDLNRLTGRA